MGIQLLWFVLLTIPVMWIWFKARRRLFVQGG
jgi:ABC-2 type transport system permease protein